MTPAVPSSAPTAHRAVALALAGGLFLLPWLQVVPVDFERGAALLVFSIALLAGAGLIQRAWLRLTSRAAPRRFVLAGALLLVVTTINAAHPVPALVQTGMLMLLCLLALLVSGLMSESPALSPLLWAGLLAGALSGVAGLAWTWWVHPDPHHAPAASLLWLYPHPRLIGLHLLPAAVVAPVLAATAATRFRRVGLLVLGGILATALIWSGGRMPLLGLAAGAVMVVWRTRSPSDRRALGFAFGAVLLAGLLASTLFWNLRGSFGWWRVMHTLSTSQNLDDLSSNRLDLWRAALHWVIRAPWLGYGPDGYRFFMPKLAGLQPHSFLLQSSLACGLPGLLLVLTGTGWLLFRPHRSAVTPQATSAAHALVTAVLVGGLFDGTLYHVLSTSGFVLGVGCLLATLAPPAHPSARCAKLIRALPTLAAAVMITGLGLHLLVFRVLLSPAIPAGPQSPAARLVRAFPSTTIGLTRWLDAWEPREPEQALAGCLGTPRTRTGAGLGSLGPNPFSLRVDLSQLGRAVVGATRPHGRSPAGGRHGGSHPARRLAERIGPRQMTPPIPAVSGAAGRILSPRLVGIPPVGLPPAMGHGIYRLLPPPVLYCPAAGCHRHHHQPALSCRRPRLRQFGRMGAGSRSIRASRRISPAPLRCDLARMLVDAALPRRFRVRPAPLPLPSPRGNR